MLLYICCIFLWAGLSSVLRKPSLLIWIYAIRWCSGLVEPLHYPCPILLMTFSPSILKIIVLWTNFLLAVCDQKSASSIFPHPSFLPVFSSPPLPWFPFFVSPSRMGSVSFQHTAWADVGSHVHFHSTDSLWFHLYPQHFSVFARRSTSHSYPSPSLIFVMWLLEFTAALY